MLMLSSLATPVVVFVTATGAANENDNYANFCVLMHWNQSYTMESIEESQLGQN